MYFINFSNEFIRFSKPLSYFETGPRVLQAGLKLVAKNDLEHLVLLPPSPEYWD